MPHPRGMITSLALMAEHLQMQPKKQLAFFAERAAADGGSLSETNPYCVLQRTSTASGATWVWVINIMIEEP